MTNEQLEDAYGTSGTENFRFVLATHEGNKARQTWGTIHMKKYINIYAMSDSRTYWF